MERVDHVHIGQVGRGRLVGDVDRMLERNVPDGKRLKLGIAGLDAALVLLIELAQAHRHLAAAGSGGRHHHQRPLRLDIVVLAEALVAVDQRHIGRITLNSIVEKRPDAEALQAVAERPGTLLPVEMGDDHRSDEQSAADELVAQPQYVHVVRNAQVTADLVLLNVHGTDDDDDFRIVAELHEHLEFAVWLKAGQHPGCMVVVEQFAAELQVQFVSETPDALPDMFRLNFQIFLVVKPKSHNVSV